jgi:hypothetical protein
MSFASYASTAQWYFQSPRVVPQVPQVIVNNPQFTSPSIPTNTFVTYTSSGQIDNWTYAADSPQIFGLIGNKTGGGFAFPTNSDINQYFIIHSYAAPTSSTTSIINPTLSQSVFMNAGDYVLSFYAAGRPSGSMSQQTFGPTPLTITIDTQILAQYTRNDTSSVTTDSSLSLTINTEEWKLQSIPFTVASSGQKTLTFKGYNHSKEIDDTTGKTTAITNIQIQPQ